MKSSSEQFAITWINVNSLNYDTLLWLRAILTVFKSVHSEDTRSYPIAVDEFIYEVYYLTITFFELLALSLRVPTVYFSFENRREPRIWLINYSLVMVRRGTPLIYIFIWISNWAVGGLSRRSFPHCCCCCWVCCCAALQHHFWHEVAVTLMVIILIHTLTHTNSIW